MMDTIQITLKHGLKLGDDILKDAEIRPLLVEDLLIAEKAKNEAEKNYILMGRRLVRLGTKEQPGEMLVKKLTANDFMRLQLAADKMDAEDLADLMDDADAPKN